MAKKKINYPDKFIVLCPIGTRLDLIAIAYHRGQKGKYAAPARDFIAKGIADYKRGLSDKDRKEFEEILASVKLTHSPLG